MKIESIESIELWSDRKIILRDTTDLQHEIDDVEVFINDLVDAVQFDEDDIDYIRFYDWSEFANEMDENLIEYINILLCVKEITFLKHARIIGESNREKYERITYYRDNVILEKDGFLRRCSRGCSLDYYQRELKKFDSLLQGLREILEELK